MNQRLSLSMSNSDICAENTTVENQVGSLDSDVSRDYLCTIVTGHACIFGSLEVFRTSFVLL